ncbi:thiol-disulfide oxidoreductase DCC family protein [Aeoliella mucimassa]|uniref:Thiol-disulfide oxidoreductase n=1 Tax=Aeoliella mucimassa TaxID=2527972 RepID=A0A518AIH3_9BACT|nr:DUF393 domain-containing protein [Aeoliella mucimassa]QDU54535.1 hypothetical protein Pan181_07170 [Aeoliella mucimassa]
MPSPTTDYDIEVFYDGLCPLCVREMDMLRRWDRNDRIRFTDITAEGFSATELGIDYQQLMDRIHGRLPDGTIVTGVEVFRYLYGAVGFRWSVAASRLPIVKQLLNAAYVVFAKNRLRLTRRCDTKGCSLEGNRPAS